MQQNATWRPVNTSFAILCVVTAKSSSVGNTIRRTRLVRSTRRANISWRRSYCAMFPRPLRPETCYQAQRHRWVSRSGRADGLWLMMGVSACRWWYRRNGDSLWFSLLYSASWVLLASRLLWTLDCYGCGNGCFRMGLRVGGWGVWESICIGLS